MSGISAGAHDGDRNVEGQVSGSSAEDTLVAVASSGGGEQLNLAEIANVAVASDGGTDGLAHVAQNQGGGVGGLGGDGGLEGRRSSGHGARRVVADHVASGRGELIDRGGGGGDDISGLVVGGGGRDLANKTSNGRHGVIFRTQKKNTEGR